MSRPKLMQIVIGTLIVLAYTAAAYGQNECAKTDYDCQIRLYRGQIADDPTDSEAYYSLARAYQLKGDYAASIPPLDRYVTSGVQNREYLADGYALRGWARHKLGSDMIAVQDLTRAIGLFEKAYYYHNRGDCYRDLEEDLKAAADYTKVIGMEADNWDAYFQRGFVYMRLKNNVPAIADFTKVMQLHPAEFESWYNRGTLYYRQKEYVLAIRDLDKYVSMDIESESSLADGYLNRGLAKYYLGRINESIMDFTKAIELMPDLKSAYSNRAAAYRKAGKPALAAADEQKAATLPD